MDRRRDDEDGGRPRAGADGPVPRSPSDVLRLVVATVALLALVVLGSLFDEAIVGAVADLLSGLASLPGWMVPSLAVIGQVLGLALLVAAVVGLLVSRRWRLLGTSVLAGAAGAALVALVRPLVDHRAVVPWQPADDLPVVADPGALVTTTGLAAVTAVVTVVSPWVARRWRRLGWLLVMFLALGHFVSSPVGLDTAAAVLSGWVAGAAVVVVFGAPSRRPAVEAVMDGLAAVGVVLDRLDPASVDARGSTPYFGVAADGTRLFVKVLGDDERSADLLFRLYRRLQPRDLGDERPFSSLRRAVEHEALVALTARDLGVRTPGLVAFASAEPNGFVLAYEAVAGRSLDGVAPEQLTPAVLEEVWRQLAVLRRHRIAHRDLRLANLFLAEDGSVWVIDFGFSELAASDRLLATDLAELLTSTATAVGAAAAVSSATAVLGSGSPATAVPYLRPASLSGATRSAVKGQPELLHELGSVLG